MLFEEQAVAVFLTSGRVRVGLWEKIRVTGRVAGSINGGMASAAHHQNKGLWGRGYTLSYELFRELR